MGKTLLGSTGSQSLITPEQSSYLSSVFGENSPYSQFLQPQSQGDLQSAFQKGVVDPSMQQFNQQVIPGVTSQFTDANAGASSALNQALAGKAGDLQTSLASQYLPFMQGQQGNTLQALGQMGGLATGQTQQPYQQQGMLGDLIAALMKGGGMFR
jgi:hypothetical protein